MDARFLKKFRIICHLQNGTVTSKTLYPNKKKLSLKIVFTFVVINNLVYLFMNAYLYFGSSWIILS